MNIILMTIILTLLGAGLVTLLVWLSVVSCKSIKLQKEQKIQISNLDVYISDNISDIYKYIDDKFKDLNMEQNERNRELDNYKDEVSNQYCKNMDTIQALSKNVDSRLDKLHSAINSINVQIADNKSDNK